MVHEALLRLKQQGATGCVVLGEPAYYGRFGFCVELALVLEGVPAGYFQALLLAGTPPACGIVTYHPAFGAEAETSSACANISHGRNRPIAAA